MIAYWKGVPLEGADEETLKRIIHEMAAYYEERIAECQARELQELDDYFDRAKARLLDPRKRSLIALLLDIVKDNRAPSYRRRHTTPPP
jgi:vacuolar-type H+-ATPase subunit E/Vma4